MADYWYLPEGSNIKEGDFVWFHMEILPNDIRNGRVIGKVIQRHGDQISLWHREQVHHRTLRSPGIEKATDDEVLVWMLER